jgi:hypothetical protein
VPVARAGKMSEEELEDKMVIGTLHTTDATEFCDEYQKVLDIHEGK